MIFYLVSYITIYTILQDFNIDLNKLTDVDPNTFALFVRKLAIIDLGNTELTTLQIETMLKTLNEKTELKWLSLSTMICQYLNKVYGPKGLAD